MRDNLETRTGIPQEVLIALTKRRELLVRNSPEIAEEYRQGKSLREIAQVYLPRDYEISPNIATNSVLYALRKLMTSEELEALGIAHKKNNPQKKKNYKKEKKDPHRVAIGKRGYQAGIVNIPVEELSRRCIERMCKSGIYPYEGEGRFVNVGLNGVQILYPMNEKDYILFLRDEKRLTWAEIENAVNESFNGNGRRPRKANSIRVTYQGWKKE